MYFAIGGGILYLVLAFTLGVVTLRKGHIVLFILGFIIFPFLWLVGAIMPPVSRVR